MSAPGAAELDRWSRLEERRRHRVAPALLAALAGAAASALVVLLQLDAGEPEGALRAALAAIAAAQILVVFGTPYRMYWRRDSALLARMPIPGSTLFLLALRRTARATGLALLPAAAACVAFGASASWPVAARLAVLAAALAALAGMLAPAACLGAGAIVASEKARAVIDSLAGELPAPSVTWLGALPGLVGTAAGLLPIVTAGWVGGGAPLFSAGLAWCGAAAALSAAGLAWALLRADLLLGAQREVAALDQERLAHVDRSTPGPLERLWGRLLGGNARLVYDKDASLLRRRYPAPYFVAVLGVALAWILAAVGEAPAAAVIAFALAAYALIMTRRQWSPPVEYPRLLRSLPLARGEGARAKRHLVLLRGLLWCGAAGASLPVLAGSPLLFGGLAAAALLLALAGGAAMAGER